jgi:hypothetical protein
VTRGFGTGDVVELTARPWSRRVTRLGVVQSRNVLAAATGPLGRLEPSAGTGPGPAPAAAAPLSAEELSGRLGILVTGPRPVPAGASGAWLFPLAVAPDAAVLVSVGSGRPDHIVLGLHRAGDPVHGLGDEAFLAPHGAVARSGDVVVRVAVPVDQPVPSGAFVAVLGAVLARLPQPLPRAGR